MVAVLYGAILLAVDGLVSLLAERDVILESDAGPLVGPIMAVTAVSVVFVSTLSGLRPTPDRRGVPLVRAIATGGVVFLLGPLVGAIVYSMGQAQALSGPQFFVKYLSSPFVVTSAVLALVTLLLLPLISMARSRAR